MIGYLRQGQIQSGNLVSLSLVIELVLNLHVPILKVLLVLVPLLVAVLNHLALHYQCVVEILWSPPIATPHSQANTIEVIIFAKLPKGDLARLEWMLLEVFNRLD